MNVLGIVIAILVFSVIVLIHEFGHFYAARKCGVFVEEFAIGMGPKLFSTEKNGTVYSIRAFPIGGFCKMLGEDTAEAKDDPRSFSNKAVWQRIIIVSAGVIMNMLLAFVIINALVLFSGFSVPIISEVNEGTPAYKAGLLAGDKIVQIDDSKVRIYQDMLYKLYKTKDKPIEVSFVRDGVIQHTNITPMADGTGRYIMGVKLSAKSPFFGKPVDELPQSSFSESIYNGTWSIAFIVKSTVEGVGQLVTFHLKLSDLSGPIGMFSLIGNTYESSMQPTIQNEKQQVIERSMKERLVSTIANIAGLVALLSANLGVFNLLPFPALDGGRLVFLILEGIRRKPISQDFEGMVHFAGFVLLIAFAIFIASSDILKLI